MTGLDEYRTDGDHLQKQTHVTLSNPDHPETDITYADSEVAGEHFRAAKSLKNASIDRRRLVGDFLVAVEREEMQGEEGAIEAFLSDLSE